MRITAAAAPAALLLLALSGCSVIAPETAARVEETPAPAAPEPSPVTEASASAAWPEGAVAKRPGDVASLQRDGATVATFSVVSIAADPPCTRSDAADPANGHFIELELEVSTTGSLGAPFDITAPAWTFVSADGERTADVVGESATCMGAVSLLPADIGAGERRRGTVVLDVPATTGSLVLDLGGGTAWGYII
jgi:hypothetical protein